MLKLVHHAPQKTLIAESIQHLHQFLVHIVIQLAESTQHLLLFLVHILIQLAESTLNQQLSQLRFSSSLTALSKEPWRLREHPRFKAA